MKRVDAILLFFLFSLSCQKLSLSNEKVVIATASNFLETLVTLKKDFESNHDIELEIRSASSGILYAQILSIQVSWQISFFVLTGSWVDSLQLLKHFFLSPFVF